MMFTVCVCVCACVCVLCVVCMCVCVYMCVHNDNVSSIHSVTIPGSVYTESNVSTETGRCVYTSIHM